jgi:hypothetical protein
MNDVERFIEAAAELRGLIRESHETIKDLRREVKEGRAALASDLQRGRRELDKQLAGMGPVAKAQLDGWTGRLEDMITNLADQEQRLTEVVLAATANPIA